MKGSNNLHISDIHTQPHIYVFGENFCHLASLVAQLIKKIYLQCRRPEFSPWVGKIHWRRVWQPTPVLLPGKFHGLSWGCRESDTTEQLSVSLFMPNKSGFKFAFMFYYSFEVFQLSKSKFNQNRPYQKDIRISIHIQA